MRRVVFVLASMVVACSGDDAPSIDTPEDFASQAHQAAYAAPMMCPQGRPSAPASPVATRTHRDAPLESGKHSARCPTLCGAHSSFTVHASPMRLRARHMPGHALIPVACPRSHQPPPAHSSWRMHAAPAATAPANTSGQSEPRACCTSQVALMRAMQR